MTEELIEAFELGIGPEGGRSLAVPSVRRMRESHHVLAALLAQGIRPVDAARMTGYTQAWISTLKNDPAFQELMLHYEAQRELKFSETIERMETLGRSFMDELQARLDEKPDGFSVGQLMEAIELLLVKPHRASAATTAAGGAVSVEVNFVGDGAKPRGEAPIVEAKILRPGEGGEGSEGGEDE